MRRFREENLLRRLRNLLEVQREGMEGGWRMRWRVRLQQGRVRLGRIVVSFVSLRCICEMVKIC